jgi:serine/threonine protein kinase
MEFIDGETLDKAAEIVLRKRSHIPVMLLSDLLDALLNALDTVHRVGVLHRDIKPANIMIRRDGQPVLIDFGAARPIARGNSAVSMFSRRYAALEQFPARVTQYKARREHGPEVDIFATSIMLYELVSRSLPPDAEERFKTLRQKGADPYLPVRQNMQRNRITADYPDALLDAIDAGCCLFPEDRLQSAREMALRMEGFLRAKLEGPAEPPLKPSAAKGSQSRRKKPALRGPILIGVIILLLATAGVLYGIFG